MFEWMQHAECRNTPVELFFADGRSEHDRQQTNTALTLCIKCTVRAACLDYYMRHVAPSDADDIGGVWGGTTLATRRRLRENGYGTRRT